MLVASVVLIPGLMYGALAVVNSRAALARASGLQLASEAQNAADRLATALRAEREALTAAARQDVMREIRIGDLDKRISSFLGSVRRGCTACLELFAVDPEGRVVAASDPARIGSLVDVGPGTGTVAGPLDDPATHRSHLRLTAPIPDPDTQDRFLGSLVALLDWERVTEATSRTRANLLRDRKSVV